MLWGYSKHYLGQKTKTFTIIVIWSVFRYWMYPPAIVIQTVLLRLLLTTGQRIMCWGMSPALSGSVATYYEAGYMPSGSTDPEPQLLHIPFPEVVYRLQYHWHGDGRKNMELPSGGKWNIMYLIKTQIRFDLWHTFW